MGVIPLAASPGASTGSLSMFLCLQGPDHLWDAGCREGERRPQALQLLAGQVLCSGGAGGSLQSGLGDAGSASGSTRGRSVCAVPCRAAPAEQSLRVPCSRVLRQARRSRDGGHGRPENAPFLLWLLLSACVPLRTSQPCSLGPVLPEGGEVSAGRRSAGKQHWELCQSPCEPGYLDQSPFSPATEKGCKYLLAVGAVGSPPAPNCTLKVTLPNGGPALLAATWPPHGISWALPSGEKLP